jgi:predicted phage tail protein
MIRTQGGTVESRVIQAVNGTQLVVATPFTAEPLPNAVFVIDAGQLRLQYFRVTNLRFDDEENTFTITGPNITHQNMTPLITMPAWTRRQLA